MTFTGRMIVVYSMLVLLLAGCHREHPQWGLGEEWMSWTQEQRQLYVSGFLVGQSVGQRSLCSNIDEKVEVFTLRTRDRLDPAETPCLHLRQTYTHTQVGSLETYAAAYVSVIDDFYKHPECRVMPYSTLLTHLNDREYKSGEDLFNLVHTGHPNWGSFTVPGGTQSCFA